MAIVNFQICPAYIAVTALWMITFFTLSGCAPSAVSEPAASAPTLEPWTPTRKGLHPGDLKNTPEASGPISHSHDKRAGTKITGGPTSTTVHLFWHLYTNTLSRQMGETCRFSPSCSRFAVDAAGVGLTGLPLAFARLQRGHLDDGTYEVTDDGHLVDPISHYFFWRSDLGIDAHQSTMPTHHAWYVTIRAAHKLPENFFDD